MQENASTWETSSGACLSPVSLPPRTPGTTCAQGPGPWGMRQRPLFQLLFSLWMSLISLACISHVSRPNLAPWVPRPEKRRECRPSSPHPRWRGMVTPGCPRPHLTSAFEARSLSSLLQAASVWGPGHLVLCPCFPWSVCCCGNSRSTVATRSPEHFRRPGDHSATGPGPVALFPPPLLHAPGLCHGHLFSTGLLICLTRSRPTAFLITAKPESPVLPTHNKNHLIK